MEDDRTTGSLSWALQLQRYLQSHPAAHPDLLEKRRLLLDGLQQAPNSAEPWTQLLQNEEAIVAAAAAGADGAQRPLRSGSALAPLYQRATELVPRARGQASEAYMQLWVGHARHQW